MMLLTKISKPTFLALLFVTLSLWLPASGQGLCDDTLGAFNIDSPSADCGDKEVEITDLSGGQNVKYIFDYKGGSAETLEFARLTESKTRIQENTFVYEAKEVPQVYTILQYGEKNGKAMYACKQVLVRKNNRPKFSYTSCHSSNKLEIGIPIDPIINNFDSYLLEIGGNVPITVNAGELPYTLIYDVILPTSLTLTGQYIDPLKGCNTPVELIDVLFPDVISGQYDWAGAVNIDELNMLSEKEAVMNFTGTYDLNGYELYRREINDDYSGWPTEFGLEPGQIEIEIPDAEKQYCFYLRSTNACLSQRSAEICTMPIVTSVKTGKEVEIQLEGYPDTLHGASVSPNGLTELIKRRFVKVFEDGRLVSEEPLDNNENTFIHDIDCTLDYCYQFVTEISGYKNGEYFTGESVSNLVCPSYDELITSNFSILASVNTSNRPIITFEDNSNWDIPVKNYLLFESGSSDATILDASSVSFLDSKNDASQKPFCYQIRFEDACGVISELSEEVCTVHLSFEKEDVVWTDGLPFGSSIISDYIIEGQNESDDSFFTLATVNKGVYQWIVSFDDFDSEAVLRIRVNAVDGVESFTNTIYKELNYAIYIPTAFSPNGDQFNNVLKIFGDKDKITEFKLRIYDRWGTLHYYTEDVDFEWNGSNQKKGLLESIYQYDLKMVIGGKSVLKKGEIWQIR